MPGRSIFFYLSEFPESMLRHRFDIEVTTQPPGAELSLDEWRPLVLEVLESRFGWRAHREERVGPAYVLRLARPGQLGPTLRRRTEPCNETRSNCRSQVDVLPGGVRHDVGHGAIDVFRLQVQGRLMDRPVVDQTGLAGDFDWELTYAPEVGQENPTFFGALEEQVGIVVEAVDVPMSVVVIDAVSLPDPN